MPARPASIIYLTESASAYYARINPPSHPHHPRKIITRVIHAIRGVYAKGVARFKRMVAKFKSPSSGAAAAAASFAVEEGRVSWESWDMQSFYSEYSEED